jgi:pentatricopeptide repeat protein
VQDEQAASRLLSEMSQMGLEPCSANYNALMRVYWASRNFNKAQNLYLEMRKKNLYLSQASYHILMKFCVRRGDYESLYKLKDEMLSAGFAITYKTNSILQAQSA